MTQQGVYALRQFSNEFFEVGSLQASDYLLAV
jgi:hypothetical protein